MSDLGKNLRLKRIFSKRTNKSIIVPMDHGVTIGPVEGIVMIKDSIEKVIKGGANGIILHKGLASQAIPFLNGNNSLIIHMSASTNIGNHLMKKVRVCSIQEAINIGADAISMHINLGSDSEPEQIKDLASLAEECDSFGMPLMVMTYVKGQPEDEYDPQKISHAVRIAAELGADIVKCNYTGDPETFSRVVEGCHVPILIAGGPRKESINDLFTMVYDAVKAGAAGISIGRNIFEQKYPQLITELLVKIVHKNIQPGIVINDFNKTIQEQNSAKKMVS